MHETYTLGYDRVAMAFVERRRLDINGAFFLPYLAAGMRVLDCGCGPGTITMDLAERVGAGAVVGVDLSESQVERATRAAAARGLGNVSFRQASAYALPFADDLIAWQLDSSGCSAEASALRQWAAQPAGMFAEAWVECVGRKPYAHAPQANS